MTQVPRPRPLILAFSHNGEKGRLPEQWCYASTPQQAYIRGLPDWL